MQNHDFVELVRSLTSQSAETNFCEFKQNFHDPDKLGTLISAISNAATLAGERNGYIVWGVQDATHAIVGTSFDVQKAVSSGKQPLELWLAQHLQPALNFSFKEGIVDEKRIVMLVIPAAYGISTKFQHIAYIRIGSTTPKLSDFPDREAALMASLKPYIWENGIAADGLTPEDVINTLDIKSFFRLLKHVEPNDLEKTIGHLQLYGVIVADSWTRLSITNMGAILFAHDIEKFSSVSRKTVRVIRYEGRSKSTTIRDIAGRKGYAAGFNGLIKYLSDMLPQEEAVVDGLRTVVTAYPDDLLPESSSSWI